MPKTHATKRALPFRLPAGAALLCAAFAITGPARAALSAEELAKLAQNPVGNLISVPFQNNTNFNTGPLSGTQNILNIQPVIPIEVNKDWNIITRTILPLIWQPEFTPDQGDTFGLGDLQLSAFLSPSEPGPGGLIWGVGTIVQAPTNTDDVLRQQELGPRADRGGAEAGERRPLGLWRAGQQRLVAQQQQGRWALQQLPDAAVRQLQLPRRLVPEQRAGASPPTGRPTAASAGPCRWAAASARSSTWASCR